MSGAVLRGNSVSTTVCALAKVIAWPLAALCIAIVFANLGNIVSLNQRASPSSPTVAVPQNFARMYRAVRVHQFGGPEQLVVDELPALKPAAGQVWRRCWRR